MKLGQLFIVGLFFLILLTTSCASRRLEYQNLPQENQAPIANVPEGVKLGNALNLPDVRENRYSYIPFDVGIVVPRPVAVFVQEENKENEPILLKEYLKDDSGLVSLATDSRFRPSVRTALPIEHVDRKLNNFLQEKSISYQSVDPKAMEMAECVTMYRLDQQKNPMFICMQMTLESVYIATQAEDAEDRSLDEEGEKMLKEFAAALL